MKFVKLVKSNVGFNAKPETPEEHIAVRIGNKIMSVADEALRKNKMNGYSTPEERHKSINIQAEAIKPIVQQYESQLLDEEIRQLVFDHLEDNNYHTTNDALEIILGK